MHISFKKVFKLLSLLSAGCLTTAFVSSCSCSAISPWVHSDLQIKWTGDKTIDCFIKEQRTISASWKVSGEKFSNIIFKKVSDTQCIDVNEDGSLMIFNEVETPREVELQVQASLKNDETKVSNIVTLKFNFTYAPIENIAINYQGGYTFNGLVGDIGSDLSTSVTTSVQPFNACPDVRYSIISDDREIQNNNVAIDGTHISWSDKIPQGTYHFRIIATSVYDDSVSAELDKDFTININWYPVERVDILYDGSKNLECFMHENGNTNTITTQVAPLGKTSQDVNIDIACQPAAPNVQWNNEIKQITWTSFDTAVPTPIKITLTATSAIDDEQTASIEFNLTVKEPNPERMQIKFLTDSGADASTDIQPIINQDTQAEGTFSITTTPEDACKDVTWSVEDDSGIGHNIRVENNKLKWDAFTEVMSSPTTIKVVATSTRVSGLQAFKTFTFKPIYAPVQSVDITHPEAASFTTYSNTAGFIKKSDGNPFTFQSTVNPVGKTDQQVTWSLQGDTASGKISFDQITHQISWQALPNSSKQYSFSLVATSVQDTSKSAKFDLVLNVNVPTVQINWSGSTDLPTYYNIAASTTEALSASVGGADADQTVEWEIINETKKGLVTLDPNTLKFSWGNLTTIGNYSFDVKATSTKYGSSATKHFTFTVDNALPVSCLNIDSSGVVSGFASTFVATDYQNKGYDTLRFPKNITEIGRYAFDLGKIPSYITTIDFSGCSSLIKIGWRSLKDNKQVTNINFSGCTNLTTLDGYCLENTSAPSLDFGETKIDSSCIENCFYGLKNTLTTLTFPGTFNNCSKTLWQDGLSKLSKLIWKNLSTSPTFGSNVFKLIDITNGTVQTINSSISSATLLPILKAAGLPSGWTAA